MNLSRLKLILVPSVLALASPAWAETRQAHAKAAQSRPLNLSLPRDVENAAGTGRVDETVLRNLHPPAPVQDNAQAPARLPYGAGYEHRHQDMGAAALGSSAGGSAGTGASAARRGR